jgi:sulfate adenylyltransferase large subunit
LPATSEARTHGLLRLATAGSVDDGKSTLIGRLLYDSKSILADQLEQVEEASRRRNGNGTIDLSLLTDGLRAEREQGITIDVAYRYFATPARKFIIADTPGHVQYTRNMVTGASTADLAIILVDARNGVVEQSKRHAYLSSLLGIPHVVVAVNKMDLVGYDEETFDRIVREFCEFAQGLSFKDVTFIPISALHGDNVVDRSVEMAWYAGPALLQHLETVEIASDRNLDDVRFPVQWVIRPNSDEHHDYRGYAGQVAGGILRRGDEVVVLPSGVQTRIAAIETLDGALEEAFPPMSVTLRLADDVDVSRGDIIVGVADQPTLSREFVANVCWMADAPLRPGARYAIKHATHAARAIVDAIETRVDVHTLETQADTAELALNDIGRVRLRTSKPLAFDPYARNRFTGSFILIDEATNDTVGAGMITAP